MQPPAPKAWANPDVRSQKDPGFSHFDLMTCLVWLDSLFFADSVPLVATPGKGLRVAHINSHSPVERVKMSPFSKIIVGALATTALAWFLHGPMKFGEKCAVGASTTPAVTAPAVDGATNATAGVTAAVPAMTPQAAACQDGVTKLMVGKTINFNTASANIAPASQALVDEIATAIKGCEGSVIEVAGHTDAQGTDENNLALSEARAKAVVAALTAKGVPTERISAKGYGETKPIDAAETREAMAKNRRIEFTATSTAPTAG
jgi:outer membrane protein OmpA-like peptidoglycan-associated protein